MNHEPSVNLDQGLNSQKQFPNIEGIKRLYLSAVQDVFLELNFQQFIKQTREQTIAADVYATNLNTTEIILDRLIFSVNQLTQKAAVYDYQYLTNTSDNLEALLIEIKKNLANLVTLSDLHPLLSDYLKMLVDITDGYATDADHNYFLRLDIQRQNLNQTFESMGHKFRVKHQFNDDYIFTVNSVSSEPDVILENILEMEVSPANLSPFECNNQEELLALFDSHSFLESTTEAEDFLFALGQIDQDVMEITDDVPDDTVSDYFNGENFNIEYNQELNFEEDGIEVDNLHERFSLAEISNELGSQSEQEYDDLDSSVKDLQDVFSNMNYEQYEVITDEEVQDDTSFELFLMNLNGFDDQEAITNNVINDLEAQSDGVDKVKDLVNDIEFPDDTFHEDQTIIEAIDIRINPINSINLNSNHNEKSHDLTVISPSFNNFLDDEAETNLDAMLPDLAELSELEPLDIDRADDHELIRENLDALWGSDTVVHQDLMDWNAGDQTAFQMSLKPEENPENATQLQFSEDDIAISNMTAEALSLNALDSPSLEDEHTYESFINALDPDHNSLDDGNLTPSVNSLRSDNNNDWNNNSWDWDEDATISEHEQDPGYLTAIEELTEFDQFEGVHSISHIYDFSANEQLLETMNVAASEIFENDYSDLLSNSDFSDQNNHDDSDFDINDDSYIKTLEQLIDPDPIIEMDASEDEFSLADMAEKIPVNLDVPSYQIDNLADFFDGQENEAIDNLLDCDQEDSAHLLDLSAITPELVNHNSIRPNDGDKEHTNEYEMFWQNLQDIVTGDDLLLNSHDSDGKNDDINQSLNFDEFNDDIVDELSSETSSTFSEDTEPSSGLTVDLNLSQQLLTSQKIEQFNQHKKPIKIAHEELKYLKKLSESTLSRQTLLQQGIKGLQTVTSDLMAELSANHRNHRLQELLSQLHRNLHQIEDNSQGVETSLSQIYHRINQSEICSFRQVSKRLRQLVQQWSMVYDQSINKNVELCITGEDTWIDRQLTDVLYDVLQHLLRNAYEHGIESTALRRHLGKHPTGIITIQAESNLQNTVISIHDDGAGFDMDKIRSGLNHRQHRKSNSDNGSHAESENPKSLSLNQSLSQADPNNQPQLSSSQILDHVIDLGFSGIKGMGVGLDIVRQTIQELGGTMKLETATNRGTNIILSIPSVPQLVTALVLEQERMLIALPNYLVHQVMPFNSECLQLSNQVLTTGQESYLWEDELLPLIRLDHYLHINCHQRETYLQYRPSGASQSVVIVNQNEQRCALIVEACWGLHQGVMQQVSGDINLPTPFIGCFMINNRQVVPVLNPEFLQEILV